MAPNETGNKGNFSIQHVIYMGIDMRTKCASVLMYVRHSNFVNNLSVYSVLLRSTAR